MFCQKSLFFFTVFEKKGKSGIQDYIKVSFDWIDFIQLKMSFFVNVFEKIGMQACIIMSLDLSDWIIYNIEFDVVEHFYEDATWGVSIKSKVDTSLFFMSLKCWNEPSA